MPTKPRGPKPKPRTNPLAGYVTAFYHIQRACSQPELLKLIETELEGKRRENILRLLVGRLFDQREDEYLKSIGVNPNA
jgi:hypothetical protein